MSWKQMELDELETLLSVVGERGKGKTQHSLLCCLGHHKDSSLLCCSGVHCAEQACRYCHALCDVDAQQHACVW